MCRDCEDKEAPTVVNEMQMAKLNECIRR